MFGLSTRRYNNGLFNYDPFRELEEMERRFFSAGPAALAFGTDIAPKLPGGKEGKIAPLPCPGNLQTLLYCLEICLVVKETCFLQPVVEAPDANIVLFSLYQHRLKLAA